MATYPGTAGMSLAHALPRVIRGLVGRRSGKPGPWRHAWHTAWVAIEAEAKARVGKPERLRQVKTLGVDEHIWRPSRVGQDRAVTIMVDLTRDQDGCLHARLLDAVVGRSGTA